MVFWLCLGRVFGTVVVLKFFSSCSCVIAQECVVRVVLFVVSENNGEFRETIVIYLSVGFQFGECW